MPSAPAYGMGLLKSLNQTPKAPNVTPPYSKGRKLDGNQKMRIFPSKGPSMKPIAPATKASPPTVSSGNPPVFNKRSAFKAGFLSYVARKGMLPDEYFTHIKQAFLDPASLASAGAQGVSSGVGALGSLATSGALLGVLAPLLSGTATGSIRELFSTPSPESAEVLRKMEQIGLYKRLTNEIKARSSLKTASEKRAGLIALVAAKLVSKRKSRKNK